MYVGFDTQQHCCEDFSWVITKEKPELNKYSYEDAKLSEEQLEKYWFDGQYMLQFHEGNGEQNAAAFMLHERSETYNPHPEKVYLVLLNTHNGYYSHGFEVKKKEETVHKGSI
jgi:hypothetical protein